MNKILYLWALAAIVFAACSNPPPKQNPLSDYYFPYEKLQGKGLVYEYATPDGKAVDHYCLYKSNKNAKGNWELTNSRFNGLYQNDMEIVEHAVANGVVCDKYDFIVYDTLGNKHTFPAQIIENVLFPFAFAAQDSSAPYRFKMDFSLPPDTDVVIHYTRERRFKRFTEFDFQGKKIPAVEFATTETYNLNDYNKGGDWNRQHLIKEIYAEGIGLVYHEKAITGDTSRYIYQLRQQLSPDNFTKQMLGQ